MRTPAPIAPIIGIAVGCDAPPVLEAVLVALERRELNSELKLLAADDTDAAAEPVVALAASELREAATEEAEDWMELTTLETLAEALEAALPELLAELLPVAEEAAEEAPEVMLPRTEEISLAIAEEMPEAICALAVAAPIARTAIGAKRILAGFKW